MSNSYLQSSFLGGEWGSYAQGRMDDPLYKIAMRVCYNGMPLEEGAWTRRSGTRFIGVPPAGAAARVLPFEFSADVPFLLEFSDSTLRFIQGLNYVVTTDLFGVNNITADDPSIVTVAPENDWPTGTYVTFIQDSDPNTDCTVLRNRQFTILRQVDVQATWDSGTTYATNDIVVYLGIAYQSQVDSNVGNDPSMDDGTNWLVYHGLDGQFTLKDPVTGAGIQVTDYNARDTLQVARILQLASPYTAGSWSSVRVVQTIEGTATSLNTDQAVLVGGQKPVQVLTPSPPAGRFTQFTLSAAQLEDGPYLDPIIGSVITPSLLGNGTVQLDFNFLPWSSVNPYSKGDVAAYAGVAYQSTIDGNTNIEPDIDTTGSWVEYNGTPFGAFGAADADVGRLVRLFNEPPIWDVAATYAPGDNVAYETQDGRINNGYYYCLQGNSGVPPDTNLTAWQISTTNFRWTWGVIIAVNSPTEVIVQLRGQPLLAVETIRIWRLGLYGGTTNYQPVCGTWFGGRLWLGGAIPNRLDGSQPDDPFNFSPTEADGTVTDASAIAYTLNSGNAEPLLWMKPHAQGIIMGTKSREWLAQANTAQDPLTATNIDVKPVSKYGSAAIEPVEAELSLVFVHREKRRVMEMFADVFTGKFAAPHLTEKAKHLTAQGTGVEEMCRQDELVPTIWARTGAGTLIGTSYRRVSSFSTEKPAFNGWHRHALGTGRLVRSICTDINPDSTLQTVAMVTDSTTTDDPNGRYHVERLNDLFDQNEGLLNGWFLDDAITPTIVDNTTSVLCYGLHHLEGKLVSAWMGGLDCGDYTVADGSIEVPYSSDPTGAFTRSYFASLDSPTVGYGPVEAIIDTVDVVSHTVTPGAGTIADMISNGSIPAWNNPPIADWANNKVYLMHEAFFSNSKIWQLNATDGTLLNSADHTAIGLGGGLSLPMCIGGDGFLYYNTSVGSGCEMAKLDTTTFTIFNTGFPSWSNATTYAAGDKVMDSSLPYQSLQDGNLNHATSDPAWWLALPLGSYGDGDLFSGGPDVHRCPRPAAMVGLAFDGTSYIVASCSNHLWSLNTTQFLWTGHSFDTSSAAWGGGAGTLTSLVAGPNRAKSAIVYGLSFADGTRTNISAALPVTITTIKAGADAIAPVPVGAWSSGTTYAKGAEVTYNNQNYVSTVNQNLNHTPSSSSQWSLVVNGSISTTTVGAIAPHVIDASWTTFLQTSLGSLTYDPIDGNIITKFATGDAVTHHTYMVKFNPNTLQIVWKTVAPDGFLMPSPTSRVSNGVFTVMAGSTLYVVNTQTGAITTRTVPGVTQNSFGGTYNVTDSQTGSLLASVDWSQTTGSPSNIGSTGTSFTDRPATFSYGSFAGDYVTTTQTRKFVPAVVGMNYTSQGQIMEPIRPEDAGTRAGPGFGKMRREAQAAVKLASTGQVVQFGCLPNGDFTRANFLQSPKFGQIGAPTAPVLNEMFTGTAWFTMNSQYSLDDSLGWQVARPYPLVVTAIGGFIEVQDR